MSDSAHRALAIVGVSAILPDARDVATFWQNVRDGRYSISEVADSRWDPALYYDADPSVPDKTYSKLGGWVRDWEWDPMGWRLPIPPRVSDSMDEAQKWAVACARAALQDFGWPDRELNLERTAVVLGNAMSGEQHYLTALRIHLPRFERALSQVPSFGALPDDVQRAIRTEVQERFAGSLPPITEDTMPGELSNVLAGRVANVFDLHGPNFVCDAACAAALSAIDAAAEGLVEREYDAVIVGGVDRNMGPEPFVKFSKIGALSATGTRPYADGADGFVMGEGAAFFLLKRLAEAERDGDRIYAVIRGIGGASDGKGKGITAPNPKGQKLAIERAWRTAGESPAGVGLIEGHGTSTRVGDVVEVQSLNAVFGQHGLPAHSVPLGSVKSNIGHLKGAAGAAGLLKAVMALHDKVLPPSLGFAQPNPNIDFEKTPFYVNTEAKPWDAPPDGVRRAGVSAFGFGGTNFHAVVEEYLPGRLTSTRTTVSVPGETAPATHDLAELKGPLRGALVLGAATPDALRDRLTGVLEQARAGVAPPAAPPREQDLRAPERLVIDYGDAAELASRAERSLKALAADQPNVWNAVRAQGVFRGSGPATKIAFLYTGQGSQYANMLRELRNREPIVRDTFAEADRVMEAHLEKPLSQYIFPDPDDEAAVKVAGEELRRTEITQPAVLAVDTALTRLLAAYGIVPDLVMGHSLGEYGALVASGALPFEDALLAVSARGREMANLTIEDVGRMAAVFAPLEQVQEVVDATPGNVVVANVNSRTQAVIGGATEPVTRAMAVFEERGTNVVPLPVSHAFHTTIVAPASEPLRRTLEGLRLAAPEIPLVGNVEGTLYPTGPGAVERILDLLARQVASPVQFVKGLETLYAEGVRTALEVGPKKALHGFASDVLGERPDFVALFSNHPKVGELASFNQALCGCYAAGLGLGTAERAQSPAPSPTALAPAQRDTAPAASARTSGALPSDRYTELGRLFAEFFDRGRRILGEHTEAPLAEPSVVTGVGLGLPGGERVFDDANVERILDGRQAIDVIPAPMRAAIVDKHITRLVKGDAGGPHFETISGQEDVIKLAARGGALDLEQEFGIPAERVPALDVTTQLAIGAGIEALRDAGLPLVQHYRTTTKGTFLPERWMLPDTLRDETGVIFASAFPGFDAFADELTRYHRDRGRRAHAESLEGLRARALEEGGESSVLVRDIDHRLHELHRDIEQHAYAFDRRFLFRVLPMAHAQFAEYIGARGPNTHINSACASTTQAFALAEDWIRAGRCRRVVVIAADDCTSDNLLEWVGAGFLASGAAATDEVVENAALPFDRRRHGMILGMGAAGIVVESAHCASERGLRPICEVLSTVTANSAFHGTRLDVEHIQGVMERVISQAEQRFDLDRGQIARELVFVSHETYTPARGGSASAEVHALRSVFGDAADAIVVANTKGLTGHPMGVGIEDVVAITSLETGIVPPVPNFREPDPELGPLHLSRGGAYPVRYALRLGAGFGSQISLTLLRLVPAPDGARPEPDARGFASRLSNEAGFESWLRSVSGDPEARLEVTQRTLRVVDRGPTAAAATPSAAAPEPRPVVQAPRPAEVPAPAPAPVAAAAAARSDEDEIRARVLAIVAEKTGYPQDMLDPELDLEADLGIDTVKQAETFAAIREAWGIPRDENLQLRDYPTLEHAVRFVLERRPTPPAGKAPTPGATRAPAQAASDEDEIRARVLAIVAEKTGYPQDMLDPELDLEADLGIDTVKQAETFAAIREAWGIPRDENLQLRDYPTLEHAVRFVLERRPAPPAGKAPTPGATRAPAQAASDEDEIRARVLAIVAEKTGYPQDMLDPELDLEADLGIDTVKQAETFAAIREAWGIPRDENLQLRDYPTLDHAVQFVLERRPAPASDAAAPAASAPAEGASAPASDEDEVRARVLAIVAEKTGYPEDMLDLELDLEADLGIDTVKQAETFAAIREAWDIPRDENLQLREYPTLAHAIQFVFERRPDRAESAAVTDDATEAPEVATAEPTGVLRRIPVAVLRPALEHCTPSGALLEEGRRVVLMPDRGGVGRALARRLEQRGVQVLTLEPDGDAEALQQQLDAWRADGPVHGLYWLPALDGENDATELSNAQWRAGLRLRVKLLYTAARALFDELGGADRFLVCGTRLGGQHGYDDAGALHPMGGAVVGFAKAFARERAETLVKAVDFAATRKTAELADMLIDETLADPGCVEIGRVGGRRFGVALRAAPEGDGQGLALGKDTVVLVTGAAGGIVSEITADLARGGAGCFHLLDLSPAPDPNDEDVVRFAEDREGLKRAIFERLKEGGERATPVQVERELSRIERLHEAASALRAIEASGGTARWHQVDLTDGDAVAKVVGEIRAESERIDVLVHAAGLEVSRPLPDKPPEEFDRVFDVKCDGWFHLLHATRELPIRAVVLFSSIAGRFGNAGQADYSAANDLLCKFASSLRRTRPDTRALAIDWTAWSSIGMASRGSIPEIMARAGIDMLSPEDGVPMLRNELARGCRYGELLAAGALGVLGAERSDTGGLEPKALLPEQPGPMIGRIEGWGSGEGLRISTRLDPQQQPFLNDHRIDGTAVLPGVMGIEAFVETARLPFPALALKSVEDVEFLAPFKFYRDEPRDLHLSAQFGLDGDDVVADCRLLGRRQLPGREAPQETLHFTARVRLGAQADELPTRDPVPEPTGAVLLPADLYRIYFHGPAYQVVGGAWRSDDQVVARLAGELPANHEPAARPLATHPRLLELAFQAAGAEEIASSGRMGLPQSIACLTLAPGDATEASVRVAAREPGSAADAEVLDTSGRVLLRLEGYRTAALPQTLDAEPLRAALL